MVVWLWREADLSPTYSAGVKNEWSNTSTAIYFDAVDIYYFNMAG